MTTIQRSWLPAYAQRTISRRKFLAGAAAGAGAAALIACGGGGSGPKLAETIDPAAARMPGAVWYARNDYQLADETAAAVAGGIYPDRQSTDLGASLDPFLGTGTTGMLCKMFNRRFIGFEIDKEIYQIAKERIDTVFLGETK